MQEDSHPEATSVPAVASRKADVVSDPEAVMPLSPSLQSQAIRALHHVNTRLQRILDASGAAIWDWDIEASELQFSRAMLDLLHYPASDLARLFANLELVHPDDRSPARQLVRHHLQHRRPMRLECRLRLGNGGYRWFRVTAESTWANDEKMPAHSTGSIVDITEQRQGNARIYQMARQDALTEIPHRLQFNAALVRAIDEADRSGKGFALIIVNLDDFHSINDSFGQAFGDALLKEVAALLRRTVPAGECVARLGGDEFGIILGSSGNSDSARICGETILAALCEERTGPLADARVSACIGVSCYPGHGETPDELLLNADVALMKAREEHQETGCCVVYDPETDAVPRFRRTLDQHLELALESGQFCIDYQAEATLPARHVVAAEALLRWQHPERGRLGPMEFIGSAESSGLIVALGQWLLDQVCRDLCAWLGVESRARIAINLSPVQVTRGDVVTTIAEALDRHGCPARCLEVEVTEHVLLHDLTRARDVLGQLHDLGVLVSLDDFGSGYSSLAYLQQLPIDKLKIDRVFVSRMLLDDNSRIITETIINLAHSLGLQVLAEGVETEGQAELLQALGCDLVQGFLIARPQSFERFIRSLHRVG